MPWPLVNVFDSREILLKRCRPSMDTATTAPFAILFGKSDFWLGHVAEWPIQSGDSQKLE